MELTAAIPELPCKGDDLADHKLRHTARVAEGGVEDRNPHSVCCLQITKQLLGQNC